MASIIRCTARHNRFTAAERGRAIDANPHRTPCTRPGLDDGSPPSLVSALTPRPDPARFAAILSIYD